MESYIDFDSIGFELVKYLNNYITSNNKDMNVDNFKFTSKTLKYVFGDKLNNPKFKDYVISTLKKFISDNLILPKDKSMYITEKMITNYYNIN